MSKINMLIESMNQPGTEISENLKCSTEIRTNKAKQLYANTIQKEAKFLESELIREAPAVSTANIARFKKLLVPFYARSAASMIAVDDLVSVTPMSSSIAQVNFMRRIKGANSGTTELLYNTLDSASGGTGTHAETNDPFVDVGDTDTSPADGVDDAFSIGTGYASATGEALGESGGTEMDTISTRLDAVTLEAKTRKLKTIISDEAFEDALNEVGLNIIQETLLTAKNELQRSVFTEVYARLIQTAKLEQPFDFGNVAASDAENLAQKNFVLWSKINEMKASIRKDTLEPSLRFKIVASSTVAARLQSISTLDVKFKNSLGIENYALDNNGYKIGTLGEYDVYEDPFATKDYVMVVGKGEGMQSPLIFGNYVPLAMKAGIDPGSMQNIFVFRRRDALITQPFANDTLNGAFTVNNNKYARKMRIDNATITATA